MQRRRVLADVFLVNLYLISMLLNSTHICIIVPRAERGFAAVVQSRVSSVGLSALGGDCPAQHK